MVASKVLFLACLALSASLSTALIEAAPKQLVGKYHYTESPVETTDESCGGEEATDAPVVHPTHAPVQKPTHAPVERPTRVPVHKTTRASVEHPTNKPVVTPTQSPAVCVRTVDETDDALLKDIEKSLNELVDRVQDLFPHLLGGSKIANDIKTLLGGIVEGLQSLLKGLFGDLDNILGGLLGNGDGNGILGGLLGNGQKGSGLLGSILGNGQAGNGILGGLFGGNGKDALLGGTYEGLKDLLHKLFNLVGTLLGQNSELDQVVLGVQNLIDAILCALEKLLPTVLANGEDKPTKAFSNLFSRH